MKKVTDEELTHLVSTSYTVVEVIKRTGRRVAGGTHTHYSRRINRLGLDTSHFKRTVFDGSSNRLSPEGVFNKSNPHRRVPRNQLHRAMIESGTQYVCVVCDNPGVYMGTSLTLQVDHIDGDWTNNQSENLRFLCPNCHTQTATYGKKAITGA